LFGKAHLAGVFACGETEPRLGCEVVTISASYRPALVRRPWQSLPERRPEWCSQAELARARQITRSHIVGRMRTGNSGFHVVAIRHDADGDAAARRSAPAACRRGVARPPGWWSRRRPKTADDELTTERTAGRLRHVHQLFFGHEHLDHPARTGPLTAVTRVPSIASMRACSSAERLAGRRRRIFTRTRPCSSRRGWIPGRGRSHPLSDDCAPQARARRAAAGADLFRQLTKIGAQLLRDGSGLDAAPATSAARRRNRGGEKRPAGDGRGQSGIWELQVAFSGWARATAEMFHPRTAKGSGGSPTQRESREKLSKSISAAPRCGAQPPSPTVWRVNC